MNVVNFIRKYLKLGDEYSEEEVHRVSGIIDINAFELKDREKRYSGIFFMSAMMAHSCITNTSHALVTKGSSSQGDDSKARTGVSTTTVHVYVIPIDVHVCLIL
jgi:hypothetical protein